MPGSDPARTVKLGRTLLLATAALLAPATAYASSRNAIDLPAGRLGDAIVALSRATGASIRLSDPALWQRQVRSVRGRLTVEQALGHLLAGTSARPVAIGAPKRTAPSPAFG